MLKSIIDSVDYIMYTVSNNVKSMIDIFDYLIIYTVVV